MGLFGKKTKNEKVEVQAVQNTAKSVDIKAEEESKLTERYNKVMPIVKRYLDSIGFELPPEESIFFMQIEENTGKWKYDYNSSSSIDVWEENSQYLSTATSNYAVYYRCKYKLGKKKIQIPTASGILLNADGKAFIGAVVGSKFLWHTEDGKDVDKSFQPVIQNVLAVGNITSQLLCGLHIKSADASKVPDNDKLIDDCYTNEPDKFVMDDYRASAFPMTVKRAFILPSDDYEAKNTVVIGGSFSKCANLRLFFSGFEKCVHEKWFMKEHYYSIFHQDSHGTFICPSADCDILNEKYLAGRSGNFAERNWELKVGTTIQNAVSPAEAAKQESENIRAALEANAMAEVNAKLSEKKEELSKLEAALAAKKAEVASLGMDAQAIVKKAALNKEIKELEPKVEALKAEIEKLSK